MGRTAECFPGARQRLRSRAPVSPTRRLKLLVTLSLAVLALLLALSWNDILPGSWRLQGWVLGIEGRDNRERLQHAAQRRDLFRSEREQVDPGAVVFLGSSTIERFPLDQIFPGKHCLNRGINGDSARDLLERLPESLPQTEPAGFVLAIGGNDLRRLHMSAESAAESATQLMDELRKRYPMTPIIWLGLFGESQVSGDELGQVQDYNRLAREAAAARSISFVPAQREELVDADGRLRLSHAADRYHLNLAGYLLLGQWIADNGGTLGALLRP